MRNANTLLMRFLHSLRSVEMTAQLSATGRHDGIKQISRVLSENLCALCGKSGKTKKANPKEFAFNFNIFSQKLIFFLNFFFNENIYCSCNIFENVNSCAVFAKFFDTIAG